MNPRATTLYDLKENAMSTENNAELGRLAESWISAKAKVVDIGAKIIAGREAKERRNA